MMHADYAYVGRCRICGAVCMAQVDDPERPEEVSEALSSMLKANLMIEHVTGEYVREHFGACQCESKSPAE